MILDCLVYLGTLVFLGCCLLVARVLDVLGLSGEVVFGWVCVMMWVCS